MDRVTERAPAIIEKTIDFMASTYAFREYLKQRPALQATLDVIPKAQHTFFLQRLNYYRKIYMPPEKT